MARSKKRHAESRVECSLRRFRISQMKPINVSLFVGPRETGKSVVMSNVAYHIRNIPYGIANCPTDDSNPTWCRRIPRCFVWAEYNPDSISSLLAYQDKRMKELEQSGLTEDEAKEQLERAFIILDDCGFDPEFKKCPVLRELLMNGRHYKITIMIALQYCLDVTPAMRSNVDYVFLTMDKSASNRKKIYDNWSGGVPTLKAFNRIMDKATENYGVMVIDVKGSNSSMRDSVFHFRADLGLSKRPFRMGGERFWAFAAAAGKSKFGNGGFGKKRPAPTEAEGGAARKRAREEDADADERLRTAGRNAELSVRLLR